LSKNDIFAIYQYKELIIQAIIKLQISTIPDVNQFYFSSDWSDESKTYFDSVKWKMALNSMNLNNNRIKVVLDFYNDTDANQKVLEVLLNGLHAIQSN
jgi:CRISPR/Cas system-associated protein Csx1